MKPLFASLWRRRWCRLLCLGLVLIALPMAHPYPRQLLLGQTIEGRPWCVWEDAIRDEAHRQWQEESWLAIKLKMVHFPLPEKPDTTGPFAFPVYLDLAHDSDSVVRRHALEKLPTYTMQEPPARILAVLREHLDDGDPSCRLAAAKGVWQLSKDPKARDIANEIWHSSKANHRSSAVYLMAFMAKDDPELFDTLAKATKDFHPYFKIPALEAMPNFGKRGLGPLRAGLMDRIPTARHAAVKASPRFGKDAIEFIPILQELTFDGDREIRRAAAGALREISPEHAPLLDIEDRLRW
jgi:HEAT repeat protein